MRMKTNFKKLLISLGAHYLTLASVFAVYGAGCIFSGSKPAKKPFLCPDGRLICVLGIIICAISGLALYRVLTSPTTVERLKNAVTSNVVALFFCFLWAFTFFVLNEYCFAFVWFLCVMFFLLNTRRHFFAINKAAGYLLIPQIIFTLFCGYLNLAFWVL